MFCIAVDKKIYFLVCEVMQCSIGITCISKTKWFGKDVYKICYTVLHSGHVFPVSGDTLQYGESVAIVLDPLMSAKWQNAGEMCVSVELVFSKMRWHLLFWSSRTLGKWHEHFRCLNVENSFNQVMINDMQ